jgi:hypothetical protein
VKTGPNKLSIIIMPKKSAQQLTKQDLLDALKPIKDDLKALPTKEYLSEAIETSQDSLARIINQGFQETQDMMSKGFKEVNRRLDTLEEDREVVERVRDALAIHS